MPIRSAVAETQAQGSAREGVEHWKLQRLTALANIPLILWFVISLATLAGSGHAEVAAWVSRPINSILLILLVLSTFWHARLGLQVIVEDYVHSKSTKLGAIVGLNLGAVALSAACVVSILKVSLGS